MQYTTTVIKQNIFPKFTYHALRHTHASMMFDAGINEKYIAERLGHKNVVTTLKTYIHVTEYAEQQGTSILNALYCRKENDEKSSSAESAAAQFL